MKRSQGEQSSNTSKKRNIDKNGDINNPDDISFVVVDGNNIPPEMAKVVIDT